METIQDYYKQFTYKVAVKLSVQHHKEIKDYAKKGCYIYIIYETIDNNRFIYISNRHLVMHEEIDSNSFEFHKITNVKESVYLKKEKSKFNQVYFSLQDKKNDISIVIDKLGGKQKSLQFLYKTHDKKIALDNPTWFIDYLKSLNIKSFKKKLLKEVLKTNEYNQEIINHFISTLFILDSNKYQKFNDHTIVLDEGKTGKTTLIAHNSEKADNISIAGLYGSSNSKAGKFEGGLITLTKKAIVIDEINELAENTKQDKILSILNTILENGEYNYIKQFSAKLTSASQFLFLGNISINFNFALFLESCFGNVVTIGRRIGIITYNSNLNGYKAGQLRDLKPSKYTNAISKYLSLILNQILKTNGFLTKLQTHKKYLELSNYYRQELIKLSKEIENPLILQFLHSHKEAIDRIIFRALKLHIFNNLDLYLNDEIEFYDNHLIFKILEQSFIVANQNIINLKNVVEHLKEAVITSRKNQINLNDFEKYPKSYQEMIRVFYNNQNIINQKGISYEELEDRSDIRKTIYDIKRYHINPKLKDVLLHYGCNISKNHHDITFRFVSKERFLDKIKGLFEKDVEKYDLSIKDTKIDDIEINDLT